MSKHLPKILFLSRHPQESQFSIENVFKRIIPNIPNGFRTEELVYAHPSKGLWNRIKIVLEGFRQQSDILHLTGDINFAILGLVKGKTVITIHDLEFHERAKGLKRMVLGLFWIHIPCLLADSIVVISEATKADLLKIMPGQKNKIRVIYNPLTINAEAAEAARKFPAETKKKYLLLVGTKKNKNVIRTLKAIHELKDNIKIIIVGKLDAEQKKYAQTVRNEIEEKAGISDTELYQLYIHAEMLVFCSIQEGFGLPILEAQYFGCPVLTSDLSSMPEVGGRGVCYANPLSIKSINKGISRIMEDEGYRQEIVDNGYGNINRFSLKKIVGDYATAYKELLG